MVLILLPVMAPGGPALPEYLQNLTEAARRLLQLLPGNLLLAVFMLVVLLTVSLGAVRRQSDWPALAAAFAITAGDDRLQTIKTRRISCNINGVDLPYALRIGTDGRGVLMKPALLLKKTLSPLYIDAALVHFRPATAADRSPGLHGLWEKITARKYVVMEVAGQELPQIKLLAADYRRSGLAALEEGYDFSQ